MISFGQLESKVRTLYESESDTRWVSNDYLEAANDGLDELAEATGFWERYVTIPVKGGQTYYDLRNFGPENITKLKGVFNPEQQIWLTPMGYRDMRTPRWETVTGAPQAYLTRGAFWLGLYPHPDADDTGFVRVYYEGLAPNFRDADSVISDIPDDFMRAVEDYMLYDLSANDGDSVKTLLHWADYSAREKKLSKFVEGRVATARVGRMGRR